MWFHQTFQVPKMKVLSLIRLFWGWIFPYISLTYLKCLVMVGEILWTIWPDDGFVSYRVHRWIQVWLTCMGVLDLLGSPCLQNLRASSTSHPNQTTNDSTTSGRVDVDVYLSGGWGNASGIFDEWSNFSLGPGAWRRKLDYLSQLYIWYNIYIYIHGE